MEGEKWPIFDFQPRPFLGDALLGWHFCPKWVVDGWDHLMHAREESGEGPKALSIQARGKDSQQNQTNWDLWVVGERECTRHA